jgi:hypothetical protein
MGNLVSILFASGLIASGPIVINGERDVVISGLHITNASGNCIEIRNAAYNVIIENSEIGPCGKAGIDITKSEKVIVRDSYIHDTVGVGVFAYESNTITVTGNQIDRTKTGVYAHSSQQIKVTGNHFDTVHGKKDATNGLAGFVEFARVSGYGNRINNNVTFTALGTTDVADDINIWKSEGMPDDPIQVNNNVIIGSGDMKSGSGIMIGDGGSSYTVAKGNILVNPGSSAIAVAGGHHNSLIDNTVYSQQLYWSIVGLYVWDQYDSNCHSITVRGNRVNWTKRDGNTQGAWNGNNCGTIDGWSDNDWKAPIDESIANGYM